MTAERPHIEVTCLPCPPNDGDCMVIRFSNGEAIILSAADGARLKAFARLLRRRDASPGALIRFSSRLSVL